MFILCTILAVEGIAGTLISFTQTNQETQHSGIPAAMPWLLILAFCLTLALASALTASNLNN